WSRSPPVLHSFPTRRSSDLLLIMKDGIERHDLSQYLDHLGEGDNRVKLFANERRSGIAYSLNRLVERASGTYLARMDADDVSLRSEEHTSELQSQSNLVCRL